MTLADWLDGPLTCSHPANNPTEIEDRMARGFTVFTMQRRNAAANAG